MSPPPPSPKSWWKKPSITVPSVLSVIAASIAGASLGMQIAASNQADNAARYSLARLVAAYQQPDEPYVVVIQNLGLQPVYNLYLEASVTLSNAGGEPTAGTVADGLRWFSISVLPPCAETAISFDQTSVLDEIRWVSPNPATSIASIISHAVHSGTPAVSGRPISLMFTDANGQNWTMNPRSGTLKTTSFVPGSAVTHPLLDGVRTSSCS